MSRHPFRVAVALLAVLVAFGGLPTTAVAQQPGADAPDRTGGVVRVDENETVDGPIDATSGAVVVAGTVDGDVSAAAGSVLVTDSGRVTGDLDAAAGGGSGADLPTIPAWVGAVYSGLTSLLLGGILLLATPRFSSRLAEVGTTRPLRSGGIGLLTLLGTPVALLILFVTIVGIPVSIVGILVFGAVVLVATVYGAFVLGTWLLSLGDYRNRWAALVVGVVVAAAVQRLPVVGGVFRVAVLLLGLGALATALYELRDGGDEDDDLDGGGPGPADADPDPASLAE